MKVISESKPEIIFEDPDLFADHQKNLRSGHLGHAMVEYEKDHVLAFYSNCSGLYGGNKSCGGHSMYGWVEYKRSLDGGVTWGEPEVLKYSYDTFIDGIYKIGCEKAVVCDDGTIVVFCLRSIGDYFEPYDTPVCLISRDKGESWSEPIEVHNERGRIYDAIYRDGKIYALEFCYSTDSGFICNEPGAYYKLLVSDDGGRNYRVQSVLPFDTIGCAYGNMIFRKDGSLIAYVYNEKDEYSLNCVLSSDNGESWGEPFKIRVDKIARNPQVAYLNGYYIMHARSENGCNFVFYYSDDAINWSDGVIVSELLDGRARGGCYYSNSIVLKTPEGKDRLLVQYSERYQHESARVNVCHAWLKCE